MEKRPRVVPMEQFPMFKLATLLARQMASPVATRIKGYAVRNQGAGRMACVLTARYYRTAELRFKMWSLGLPVPARPPPLSEADAMQIGGDILGEMIVFSLGAAIIVFEVNRQAAKTEAKKLATKSKWVAVKLQLEEIKRELELQQADIERLSAVLNAYAKSSTT